MLHDTLYKVDTTGRTRVWQLESDGSRYRTIAGLLDGKKVTSEWVQCHGKNIGRSNETTPEQQALNEVESLYKKQLAQGGYTESVDNMGVGYFEPMLAKKYEVFAKKPSWPVFSQPKLDGVRCIINSQGMWSREGKPIPGAPHIFEYLSGNEFFDVFPDAVLDGELYNHELKDDFNEIISMVRREKNSIDDLEKSRQMIQYHIYDVFFESRNHEKFSERFFSGDIQEQLLVANAPNEMIRFVRTTCVQDQDALDELYAEYMAAGYEGQMLRLDGQYENKRSKYLLKRKEFIDDEFEVVSVSEGKGNWSGYAKSIECRNKDGSVFSSGVKGNQEFTRELLGRSLKYVTVRYQNLTPDGVPRFPVAVAFWEEKRDM